LPVPDRIAADELPPWRDTARPVAQRVADLLDRMTLAEKVGQLASVWISPDSSGGPVVPYQHELTDPPFDWAGLIAHGLGQLTRPLGTAPVDPATGTSALAKIQAELVAAGRFGIPAVVHEECLTGLMTWGATIYPTPLAWGASFDPQLVERMAAQIGAAMRDLGVHQGLAPVLDVARDPRWGRTEETIGEDPYLVATVGTGYVRGLQSAGVLATLKHFVGYSASRAGRNFGPVGMGPRELADVLLLPFEMAVRDGAAGSVMHSYADVDGVPAASSVELLTGLLRDDWQFPGTVVADYFGVAFLELLHHVAGTPTEAAGLALRAGVDIELPTVRCFGEPLLAAVRDGAVAEELIDRAARRVLLQKCELGLLDGDWNPTPPVLASAEEAGRAPIDLDPPAARAIARTLAEESVVLLANDGALPLRRESRIALVGPQADTVGGMLGCYTFPSHVGSQYPDMPLGVEIPTLLDAVRAELPDATIGYAAGSTVDGDARDGFPEAVAAARGADVCVAVLGDRSGLFGRGTSGEGSDVEELRLPGVQEQLLEELLGTGTPVVLVLLTGRPYALGAFADRLAAIVQAFFPGEEGGAAVAGVLSGRVCPSGRLPVSVPRRPGGQPATYLATTLGQRTEVSSVDPTPLYPFGHGLSYTTFDWRDVAVDGQPVVPSAIVECAIDGALSVSVAVSNTGDRAGAEVVQLYLHDPVAQVTRPVVRLIGYARVPLSPGESRRVSFAVHADLTCFTGRAGVRVVEPGELELRLSSSSSTVRQVVRARLVGPERVLDHGREMVAAVILS
jgi:beta-xylosidase